MEIQEIKIVQSSESPNFTEELQGKILVNFNVEEKYRIEDSNESTETIYYEYRQITRPKGDTDERIEKYVNFAKIQLMQEYIDNTGWIWEKYKRNVEVLQNITKEEFLEKYQEVIDKQEECRKLL